VTKKFTLKSLKYGKNRTITAGYNRSAAIQRLDSKPKKESKILSSFLESKLQLKGNGFYERLKQQASLNYPFSMFSKYRKSYEALFRQNNKRVTVGENSP
jgi:hypothetical protein